MNKVNPTRSLVRLLVVCFLFFSFISSSINLSAAGKNLVGFSLVKKVKDPSHPDNSFPVEDQEKEMEGRGEDKCENTLLYLDTFHDGLLFFISFSNLKYTVHHIPCSGNSPGVPIYISKRALLI
jgi:hypothetical protein